MKRRKTARPLELDPRQWMPLAEALQRARGAFGPINPAANDLHGKLLHGRLQAAYWVIVFNAEHPGGRVTSGLIKPVQWIHYRPDGRSDGTAWLRCIGERDFEILDRRGVHIFIRRAEFDRYYPLPAAAVPAPDDKPQRRTPGPRPEHEWKTFVVGILAACKHFDKPVPTAAEICKLVGAEFDWEPDVRTMQKALNERLP